MRMMCVMQFSSNICKPGGAHISLYRWGYQIDKEPVVQSIVSLTTLLRRQLTTLSNALLFFFVRKLRIFCNACKRFSRFSNEKITAYL